MYRNIFEKAVKASRELVGVSEERINSVLGKLADYCEANWQQIADANRRDLLRMDKSSPLYDRLLLNEQRIRDIAADIRNVASLTSPLGEVLSETVRPNGMTIRKIRVPFGVVGAIYEARPNVSLDIFSLALKSGNASVLKGGSDAQNSNEAIVAIIKTVLQSEGLDPNTVTLLPHEREATDKLLAAVGYVDVVIPRGSAELIKYVRNSAQIPVIETGAGLCHTYFDRKGDVKKGAKIIFNAKTRRVSVCNALETLLVHKERVGELYELCGELATKGVVIYADEVCYDLLKRRYPLHLLQRATEENYRQEYLDYKMSLRCVKSIEEAVEHINTHSTKHSETIITEDTAAAEYFSNMVDSACVYTNVSTAFTDGAQFGLGAEVGISTQKLHARGPMALEELTSYKYIINGDGQIRE